MSKFLVAKKRLELSEETGSSKLLVSKQVTEISDNGTSNFSVLRKYSEITTTVTFDSCGGSSVDNISFVAGKTYGELPIPSKSQHIFLGWYTQQTGGTKITSDSVVSVDITKLYAQWELVNIDSSNCTSYEVITTSSYKNTGIYEASIKSSSTPIYIDWGDGSVEKLTSNISQKSHTYSSAGTFTVKISNNITSFAPSYNNSTWYGTTSQNRYTFNRMISTGSNINSLPSYAFYYCQKMKDIDFMETCFTNITSLPSYCFYYCSGLTSIQGVTRYTSLGDYCFQYCTGLSGVQDLSNFKFTSLTNSYVFANCSNVKRWILPTIFNGTTFGSYMFYNNTQLTGFGQELSETIIQDIIEIDYLESTGTQCINTQINVNSSDNIRLLFDFLLLNRRTSTGNNYLFSTETTDDAWLSFEIYNQTPYYAYANVGTTIYIKWTENGVPLNQWIHCDYYVNANEKTININGWQNINSSYSGNHGTGNLYIYSAKNFETTGIFAKFKPMQIYMNDILVRDLIPVRVGNTGYMYDKVSGQLFGNQGTGNFVLGPDKENGFQTQIEQQIFSNALPNTLTSVGSYCFQNCSNLKSIIIPQNVKSINTYAFHGCTALSSIDYQATDLTSIGNYAFYNCTSNRNIQVPDSVKSIGSYAFYYNYNTNASSLNLPNGLTSLGTYAYNYCYNLKNLSIPSSLTSIGDYAFAGCRNLSGISDYRLTAQTVGANTFGNTTGTGTNAYTGYSTRGNNKLSVYVAATGYDESYWNDPLQNPDKGGFQLDYLDPENIKYCNITLNAGNGSVSESTLRVMQGKKIGTLPTPTCPAETPYFGGWYTGQDGTGEKYKADSLAPNQDTLTLYAYYGTTPFASYTVDLNGQWVKSTSQSNPDDGQYDGVYESNSNYNVNSGWAKMYIRISGYTQFTIYIRSYAESSYDYVVAMNLDVDVTSNPSSGTSGVKAHTSGKQNSSQAIGGYTKVEYTNIDGGEHFICVVYRKDSSVNSGNDRGYVLIEQPANPIAITFDIGNGELTSGDLTAIGYQGRPMGNIAPKVEGNSGSPYFVEWNTMPDGSGNAYSSDTMLPISSTLTLYAIYSDQFPYTFIEYLEGRNSFIDTKHNVTVNTQMEFEIKLIEDAPGQLIGASYLYMSDSNDYRFFYTYEQAYFDYGNRRIETGYTMDKSSWYYVKCVNGSVTINDNIFTGSTTTTIPTSETIKIFGFSDEYVDMCLKYLKIYENNVLVQDLVPVRKGNVGYMYDMVSGRIFENAGTGSFILGPDKATEPIEDILCFEAAEANSTISMQAVGDAPAVSLKTTTDGILWRDFIVGQTTICLADVGDKVYFKAKEDNAGFSTSSANYNQFIMTGKINASGNIQSLLYKDEILNEIKADYCFNRLFINCKSLLTTPELPATILYQNCYLHLFNSCSSLSSAPELPAITLKTGCYDGMFKNCSSLSSAPELPATICVHKCYYGMFAGTALTRTPILSATTLYAYCYESMFYECKNLIDISELPATELATNCYYGMFFGCTSLTQAPELPATKMISKCYGRMFKNCTSLTSAPKLIANELSSNCYYEMFNGCTSLSSIEVDFTDWKSDLSATTNWLNNVAPTGTFTCPSILPETYGTSYIPEGWNIEKKITTASEYVQDGLIAMWDGIENANYGVHNNEIKYWKDLVRNIECPYSISTETPNWHENCWESIANNDAKYFIASIPELTSTAGHTVEILSLKHTNARGTIFGSYSISNSNNCNFEYYPDNRYRAYYNGSPDMSYSGKFQLSTITYYAATRYNDNYIIYDNNGNIVSSKTTTYRQLKESVMHIGSDGRTGLMCFNGKIYAIRVYNRQLTPEEIQHNYNIDRLRFGLST